MAGSREAYFEIGEEVRAFASGNWHSATVVGVQVFSPYARSSAPNHFYILKVIPAARIRRDVYWGTATHHWDEDKQILNLEYNGRNIQCLT